jgi:hypothetical protein
MITQGDLLQFFRRALDSDSGHIQRRCVDEDEAIRLRKRCYKERDRHRNVQKRRLNQPILAYDAQGNQIGLLATIHDGRPLYEMETPFNCLRFRVVGRDLIVERVADVMLNVTPVSGALSDARELRRDEIDDLPPYPLRGLRNHHGEFTNKGTW